MAYAQTRLARRPNGDRLALTAILLAAAVFIPLLVLAGASWKYSLPQAGTSAPVIRVYAGTDPIGMIYPAHRAQGDFSLNAGAVRNDGAPRYTYAGVAVMSPRLVEPVTRGDKAPLAPLLRRAADAQRLSGEVFGGLWQDVGTAERLAELETQLASRT